MNIFLNLRSKNVHYVVYHRHQRDSHTNVVPWHLLLFSVTFYSLAMSFYEFLCTKHYSVNFSAVFAS